jgi:sterol desaturase/sphingolipid hydroxylase (fatty acid hydroxylase superfamily)
METLESVFENLMANFESLTWLAGFLIAFSVLEWLTPCNPGQRFSTRNLITDTLYFLLVPLATRFVRTGFLIVGALLVFGTGSEDEIIHYMLNGHGPLSQLPLWLQAALVFMLSDLYLYWAHRWFHGATLWRFHAIHHSSAPVDWHSTYRFHPVNVWLCFTMVDTLMLCLGFSPQSIVVMGSFNMVYSAMVHANLNWTFGPFRYLFASPVFHRWHHTAQAEGLNKNFAPTFPLLDIVFGTFYMPKGKLPQTYGVPDADIPPGFWAQLAWPFRRE